jgi:hypothetical protein
MRCVLAPMNRVLFAGCCLLLACAPIGRRTAKPSGALAITHVALFDGTGSPTVPDMTVIIDGEHIVAVGSSAATRIPPGARVLDGTGHFLIPGLWDMHTHVVLAADDVLALLVANGVTGVRDMGGDPATLRTWRSEIATGRRLGPELLFTGPVLESASWLHRVQQIHLPDFAFPNPAWSLNPALGVATAADVEQGVDSIAAGGSSYVKFRTVESREVYFAIARTSALKGLPFVGHSPTPRVTLEEASDSGQRSIEHTDFNEYLDGLSDSARRSLYEKFVRNGTWIDPTLVSGSVSIASTSALSRDLSNEISSDRNSATDGLHYLNYRMLESFRRDLFVRSRGGSDGDTINRLEWAKTLHYLRDMHTAGVRMLVGTDLGALWVFPGSSVHDELGMLVHELGFTAKLALESATREAAAFAGERGNAGTIEPGKRADCVLLRADPLAAIENTKKIDAVVVRGRLLERSDLDTLLAGVRVRAREKR